MRPVVLAFALLIIASSALPATAAVRPSDVAGFNGPTTPAQGLTVHGVVADPSGAIVPNAAIEVLDAHGVVVETIHSDGEGLFQLTGPVNANYTLVISEAGFETVKQAVTLAKPVAVPMLHITLPILTTATTVQVNGDSNVDLTASETNADTSVMTQQDLKSLPIFDNDYSTAMSAFMDSSAEGTGGAGLLVDGVEANRATVSASAVQEVRINQDPYSAQYYWPGRGQMEIITKSAAEKYHGEFNFFFRDASMNAQNALALTKPPEQRRVYEGSMTGPIWHAKNSSFLVSFNRAEEDLYAVVVATLASTPTDPTGLFQANVAAPTRDTEFSLRAAHQFGDRHSVYAQYAYKDWNAENQGVGGQTLAAGGYTNHYHEDDVILHADSTISPEMLNQLSLVGEHDRGANTNAVEAARVSVAGDFSGGSAQNDSVNTEYNFRLFDTLTWTHAKHTVKAGINVPHIDRRALDDNTNGLGSYTFAPTVASDGVTVLATALDNYAANKPTEFTQNTGDTHFVYHQQEMGVFAQDQYKVTERFSITPGLRYDWQNFLANDVLSFSPRVSFAWVVDPDHKTVLRGGGGLYYDRFGSGPLATLVRYESARRRAINVALNPTTQPAGGCVPISSCVTLTDSPDNLARLEAGAKVPYQFEYGLSLERGFGKSGVATMSAYSVKGVDSFRSVDVNAPTAASGYTTRPDMTLGRVREMQPAGTFEGSGLDFIYRGELNKWFTGFGRYTWSHYASNTGGLGWYPQNQYNPNDEWGNANWDRRNRLGLYAMFNRESVLNLAMGVFANSGTPWTVMTGADPYGDGLFNARPTGVARNSENLPAYVDVDLRWGHDWHLTPSKDDESPKLGFSAGAFNLLNHVNTAGVDNVETTGNFGEATSVAPARRLQLAMRFEF